MAGLLVATSDAVKDKGKKELFVIIIKILAGTIHLLYRIKKFPKVVLQNCLLFYQLQECWPILKLFLNQKHNDIINLSLVCGIPYVVQ